MAVMAFGAIGAWLAPAGYAALGWAVGTTVGAMYLRSKMAGEAASDMPSQYGARMGDGYLMTSSYGAAIPAQYGWGRISGNVVWASPLTEVVNTTTAKVGGGGKGGSSSKTVVTSVTYIYYLNCSVSICKGPINGIIRIWGDDTLLYDSEDPNNVAVPTALTIYLGTENQVVDPVEEADLGVGNSPAYRGVARVVFNQLQITQFGNRLPNFWFELNGSGVEI